MPNSDLIEICAVQEIFVDGFTQHIAQDGVMSCVGYRKRLDSKEIVVRLVWPIANTASAIGEAHAAMEGRQPAPGIVPGKVGMN